MQSDRAVYVRKCSSREFNPWRTRQPLLGQLDIELTERCNNACIHCLINRPEGDLKARAMEMDTVFVEDVLRQVATLGCLGVRFTGGEPLLRDDFAELYLFTRRLGISVTLFTNARRVTPELARLMGRVPPDVVEVTVYGMHAESYDSVAASPGAFDEFWRGLELLRTHNVPFVVKQSVLPPNRSEIAEFEAFAATLPHMQKSPPYAMNFELRARRDNPAKNRLIEDLRLTPEETVAMLNRNPLYVKEMRDFASRFMRPSGDRLFDCGAGYGACVDAYGIAQMCLGLRHPDTVWDLHAEVPGRMAHTPLADADMTPLRYALTEFFPQRRELRATNPDYLKRCARCFLKGLCEQCPAKSWSEYGTLDTPVEYLCDVAHAQARHLDLVAYDEHAWDVKDWRDRLRRFCNG